MMALPPPKPSNLTNTPLPPPPRSSSSNRRIHKPSASGDLSQSSGLLSRFSQVSHSDDDNEDNRDFVRNIGRKLSTKKVLRLLNRQGFKSHKTQSPPPPLPTKPISLTIPSNYVVNLPSDISYYQPPQQKKRMMTMEIPSNIDSIDSTPLRRSQSSPGIGATHLIPPLPPLSRLTINLEGISLATSLGWDLEDQNNKLQQDISNQDHFEHFEHLEHFEAAWPDSPTETQFKAIHGPVTVIRRTSTGIILPTSPRESLEMPCFLQYASDDNIVAISKDQEKSLEQQETIKAYTSIRKHRRSKSLGRIFEVPYQNSIGNKIVDAEMITKEMVANILENEQSVNVTPLNQETKMSIGSSTNELISSADDSNLSVTDSISTSTLTITTDPSELISTNAIPEISSTTSPSPSEFEDLVSPIRHFKEMANASIVTVSRESLVAQKMFLVRQGSARKRPVPKRNQSDPPMVDLNAVPPPPSYDPRHKTFSTPTTPNRKRANTISTTKLIHPPRPNLHASLVIQKVMPGIKSRYSLKNKIDELKSSLSMTPTTPTQSKEILKSSISTPTMTPTTPTQGKHERISTPRKSKEELKIMTLPTPSSISTNLMLIQDELKTPKLSILQDIPETNSVSQFDNENIKIGYKSSHSQSQSHPPLKSSLRMESPGIMKTAAHRSRHNFYPRKTVNGSKIHLEVPKSSLEKIDEQGRRNYKKSPTGIPLSPRKFGMTSSPKFGSHGPLLRKNPYGRSVMKGTKSFRLHSSPKLFHPEGYTVSTARTNLGSEEFHKVISRSLRNSKDYKILSNDDVKKIMTEQIGKFEKFDLPQLWKKYQQECIGRNKALKFIQNGIHLTEKSKSTRSHRNGYGHRHGHRHGHHHRRILRHVLTNILPETIARVDSIAIDLWKFQESLKHSNMLLLQHNAGSLAAGIMRMDKNYRRLEERFKEEKNKRECTEKELAQERERWKQERLSRDENRRESLWRVSSMLSGRSINGKIFGLNHDMKEEELVNDKNSEENDNKSFPVLTTLPPELSPDGGSSDNSSNGERSPSPTRRFNSRHNELLRIATLEEQLCKLANDLAESQVRIDITDKRLNDEQIRKEEYRKKLENEENRRREIEKRMEAEVERAEYAIRLVEESEIKLEKVKNQLEQKDSDADKQVKIVHGISHSSTSTSSNIPINELSNSNVNDWIDENSSSCDEIVREKKKNRRRATTLTQLRESFNAISDYYLVPPESESGNDQISAGPKTQIFSMYMNQNHESEIENENENHHHNDDADESDFEDGVLYRAENELMNALGIIKIPNDEMMK